jgi:hypothetical protein
LVKGGFFSNQYFDQSENLFKKASEANMTPSGSEVVGSLKLQTLHPFRVLICLTAVFVVMSD